jgi:UDP:flavonoid glycosyltransferase YjiC (YdhE family)
VIFFSFGSNVKFATLPREKWEKFANVFRKLKQRIIWTFDLDEMADKPDNVMIGKWFPQDDILAHENVKLFISHGGLGSTVEAKYHGVPVIGVPIFADQHANVNGIVSEGWGYALSLESSEEELEVAINEMLHNPKYRENVKQLSSLFRDRPQSAMELATFWIEYVIRHKGAPHMRFQGVDLNFFQRHSLDVIAFLIVVIYLVVKVVKVVVLFTCRRVCCSKKKKEKVQ